MFLPLVVAAALAVVLAVQASPEATSLLGKPLISPPVSDSVRARLEGDLTAARAALDRAPDDPDSRIWVGRRLAYLGRYRDAIAVFTEGVARFPKDARFLRHRGHRYITVREFDKAIGDLERADALVAGAQDPIEPDGQPNARNIPLTTLHSNIRYHLALAYYLKGDFAKATPVWQRARDAVRNPDNLVSATHWLYLTLGRQGRADEAARALDGIVPGLDVVENSSYYSLCQLYKGMRTDDDVLKAAGSGSSGAAVVYGVAVWHEVNGRAGEADALRRQLVDGPDWAPFGVIAAEADLARATGRELSAWNWPQWRGPSGHGVSLETRLPTTWSASQNLAWRASPAGLGTSSPIVWGDRVIVTSQVGTSTVAEGAAHPQLARDDRALAEREAPIGGRRPAVTTPDDVWLVVEAFARTDGDRLWEYRTKATGTLPAVHEKHNLATPTPVTDGQRVYAWFGNGQVVALDMDGRLAWARHLGTEFGPFRTQWGHGSSPVLFDGLLILQCDHLSDAYLLAVDARTGRDRWKVDRGDGRTSHSTPLVIRVPNGAELLVNSSERIDVYDPSTGKLLWFTGTPRQTPIPSAVFDDGRIYLSRGYRNSDYMAIRPGGRGDISASHVEWQASSGASYVPSILYYEGLLYMTNEVGVVTCADARTGQTVWRHRLGGVFFASPVAGDGKVYMISETGETFVLRAGRKPEVLARNEFGERLIASPAISQGRLFLRSDRTLFAVGK